MTMPGASRTPVEGDDERKQVRRTESPVAVLVLAESNGEPGQNAHATELERRDHAELQIPLVPLRACFAARKDVVPVVRHRLVGELERPCGRRIVQGRRLAGLFLGDCGRGQAGAYPCNCRQDTTASIQALHLLFSARMTGSSWLSSGGSRPGRAGYRTKQRFYSVSRTMTRSRSPVNG